MSEQDDTPTAPSQKAAPDMRTPSERRFDEQAADIADLREQTGKHRALLEAHETRLDGLDTNDKKQAALLEGLGRAVSAFEAIAAGMTEEHAEAKAERVELQRLLTLLRSDVASIVSAIAGAFKSPRNALVATVGVLLGAAVFGFVFALVQQVFK